MSEGSEFHRRGVERLNGLPPIVVNSTDGTVRWIEEDLRELLEGVQ